MSNTVKILVFLLNYYLCLATRNNNDSATRNGGLAKGITVNVTTPAHFEFGELSFYEEHRLPASSVNQLDLDNSQKVDQMGFGVVQVHAFKYNVTLAYNETIARNFHENGTNLGVVVTPYAKQLFVYNFNDVVVWVSISFIIYNKFVPVPGGCNLEFPIPIYPMLHVKTGGQLIEVDTPPAFDVTNTAFYQEFSCGKDNLTYESFYKRLTPNDYSLPSYFGGLKQMMTGNFSKKYNSSQNKAKQTGGIKKFYAKEPGTGMIFTTVVTGASGHSMYVPALTYSCEIDKWDSGCFNADTYTSYLSSLIIIIGVFQVVAGVLVGVVDFFSPAKNPITILTATANGAFIGAFFSILILRYFVVNFGALWIQLIIGGATLACAIVKLVLAIVIEPRVSLAISNFVINVILSNILFSATGDTHSMTWSSLFWSLLIALIVTVIVVVPFLGAVVVITVGVCVIVVGTNLNSHGFLYDALLNPTMIVMNTMSDMVY